MNKKESGITEEELEEEPEVYLCEDCHREIAEPGRCEDCEYDHSICPHCDGTGEGQYDGASCTSCRGSGVRRSRVTEYGGGDDDEGYRYNRREF